MTFRGKWHRRMFSHAKGVFLEENCTRERRMEGSHVRSLLRSPPPYWHVPKHMGPTDEPFDLCTTFPPLLAPSSLLFLAHPWYVGLIGHAQCFYNAFLSTRNIPFVLTTCSKLLPRSYHLFMMSNKWILEKHNGKIIIYY